MHLKWVEMYEKLGIAGIVFRRCGISRPTLRKCLKCFKHEGLEGLKSISRKPNRFPQQKIDHEKRAGY